MNETVVEYNGVALSLVEIGGYVCEPVYDESGVLVASWRTRLSVSAVLHNTSAAGFTAETLLAARAALSAPRKRLKIGSRDKATAAVTVLRQVEPAFTSNPGGFASDVDNGPRPQVISLTPIVGWRTAIVQWVVEWNDAPTTTGLQPAILSHRWSQSMNVDDLGYTTRTAIGVMQFSTWATLNETSNPDSYRRFLYPRYIPGFRRTRAEFVISSDYRTLRYFIEDQEHWRKPPGVALAGNGHFTVDIDGGSVTKHFSIELETSKGKNPGDLLAAAYRAMKQRITIGPTAGGIYDTLTRVQVTEDLFRGRVTLAVSAFGPPGADALANTNFPGMFSPLDPNDPIENRQKFNQPTPYGAAVIKAAAQPLFDVDTDGNPGSPDTQPKAAVISASDNEGPVPFETAMAAAEDIIIPDDLAMSQASAVVSPSQAGSTPYESVRTSVRVLVDNHLVAVPAASASHGASLCQAAPPEVRYRHVGAATRVGAAPEIPEPVKPAFGTIENWVVNPADTEVMASRADVRYTASWSYDIVVRYDPTSPLFRPQTIAGVGTVLVFDPGESIAFTRAPWISEAAHADLSKVQLPDGIHV